MISTEDIAITYADATGTDAAGVDTAGMGLMFLPFEVGTVTGLAVAFAELVAATLKLDTALSGRETKVDAMDFESEDRAAEEEDKAGREVDTTGRGVLLNAADPTELNDFIELGTADCDRAANEVDSEGTLLATGGTATADGGMGSEAGPRPTVWVGETSEEEGVAGSEADPVLARELLAAATAVLDRAEARDGAEERGAPEKLALEAWASLIEEDGSDESVPLRFRAA